MSLYVSPGATQDAAFTGKPADETSKGGSIGDREDDMSGKADVEMLEVGPEGRGKDGVIHDAVFGDISKEGPQYRNVSWLKASVLLVKSMIGLGVLAIPYSFLVLGIVPGLFTFCIIWALFTYCSLLVVNLKVNHPEIYSVADAARLLFGKWGDRIYTIMFPAYVIFCVGSGLLALSIGMNAITHHAACTVVWVFVGAALTILLSSLQTLDRIGWLTWVGSATILISLMILVVAVGIQDRPYAAPAEGAWDKGIQIAASLNFIDAVNIVALLAFCLNGVPALFPIISEMRDVREANKAVWVSQMIVFVVELIVGLTVYFTCGQYVASPALSSAGLTIQQVTYPFAIVAFLVSGALYTHISAKFVFVKLLQGTEHLSKNTKKHWIIWLSLTVTSGMLSFVVAESITVFSNLLSLIGALFGTLMSLQLVPATWIYDNWKKGYATPAQKIKIVFNALIIAFGTFIMFAGTIAAGIAIRDQVKTGRASQPFSCADNS